MRKNPRKKLPPRNTPDSFCRRFTRQNFSPVLQGGIFLLRELYLENFMSRPNVIPTFRQRRCKTGAGTSFGANGDQHTRAVELSTYFYALTIRKQLSETCFERNGIGQEPSRGHKFSILENVVLHRDFTSQTLASFPSDLVGVALVGATPLHLLSQTALPLKSPTGAFIAALRFANAVPPQTLLMVRTLRCERTACRAYITSPRSYRTDRRYNDRNECSTDP